MTIDKTVLASAWANFITNCDGNYAVSLAYNPHRKGTAGPCFRITADGECIRLRTGSETIQPGMDRLTIVRAVPLARVRLDLDRLHRQVDRTLFGTRFNKLPEHNRSGFVGFIEHVESNIHVHLSWRVPSTRVEKFVPTVTEAWRATGPSVSIHVEPIRDAGWGRYIVKDQRGAALDDPELFVASRAART